MAAPDCRRPCHPRTSWWRVSQCGVRQGVWVMPSSAISDLQPRRSDVGSTGSPPDFSEPTSITTFEARQSVHADLAAVTDTLIAEHAGHVPAGTVIRCVAQAREQLLRAGVRAGLAIAVESMARTRLRGVGQAHPIAT